MSKSKERRSKRTFSEDQICQKFIEFLGSPVWQLPTISFIEQRSIIFDSEAKDEKAYREIHAEYRSMIDFLIECFCEDLAISPAQVSAALQNSKLRQMKVQQSVLEPILAVQDYPLFVHMMTRKNVELQIQALQMIGYMCGVVPEALLATKTKQPDRSPATESATATESSATNPEEKTKIEADEEKLLAEIMEKSKIEYEKEQLQMSDEEKLFDEALKASLAEQQRLELKHNDLVDAEQKLLQLNIQRVDELPYEDTEATKNPTKSKRPSSSNRKASKEQRPASASGTRKKTSNAGDSQSEATKTSSKTEKSSKIELVEKPTISPALVAERSAYFQAQREKLLKMKQEARQQQLKAAEKTQGSQQRPKTATAARNVLKGRPASGTVRGRAAASGVTDEVLKARLALAAKLKHELSI